MNTNFPILRSAERRKRGVALIVTSLAAFVLSALTWPLAMRGYRTEATIAFDQATEPVERIREQLPSVLRSLLAPAAMKDRLDGLVGKPESVNVGLGLENIASFTQRISIGFRDQSSTGPAQLRIVLAGDGNSVEQKFVSELAADLAMDLVQRRSIDVVNAGHDNFSDANPAQKVNQADWLINQIEDGIEAAKSKTVDLLTDPQLKDGKTQFKTVGHVRKIETQDVNVIHQTLESVDVASLRGVIDEIKAGRTGFAFPNHSGKFAIETTQSPVGAIPDRATVTLLVMASLVVGSIVSLNVRPFDDKGFIGVADVAETLGVPVIATISGKHELDAGRSKQQLAWANQVVSFSSTLLLVIGASVLVFWLLFQTVRTSFAEGMFHGFARIVWILTGA